MAVAAAAPADVSQLVNDINSRYEQVHRAYEDNFWATKMALQGNNPAELARTKDEYDAFLADPSNLERVAAAEGGAPSEEQAKVLRVLRRTFATYIAEDERVSAIKAKLNALEAQLATSRNGMRLGYTDPDSGEFVAASSVLLRNLARTSPDERLRKACYEGLRTIGAHVVKPFCEIVKLRNRLAKLCGAEDFYDYTVKQAEGFSKRELFKMLAPLEERTRPLTAAARAALAASKGADALEPWNLSYALSGDVERELDPYFPFEGAVDAWARCFAALDIKYRGATMRLDLCDRPGKYSNGFCHWPQVAWRRPDGAWVPSAANFTSLATPSAVGSGKTALVTLLHEGGHAAHFANIDQATPLASQERAPTSVAYAENQSMFLDSLAGDAAWLARYALSREGARVPWALVEKSLRATHPYAVFAVRGMLSVPFFEKALYELPEERVTPEEVLVLAERTEVDVEGGPSPRPLMSVPHPLSGESCCYYHGYVLAEMSVQQTRAHFLRKYGALVDRPEVGRDLAEVYWRPGNTEPFLGLVEKLTGTPLSADAWVAQLQRPLEERVLEERSAYDEAAAAGPTLAPGQEPDLGMRVILCHGDETIGDSEADGGLAPALAKFKAWVRRTYFGEA
ncbi:hypothetical protein WJX81_000584 [Elliptochloris bilobata]|uniref:Peptidase M3A/M3B catalytic domain-containing protein n=1 Tax=Elliptochloris bilobata TaxID=381761 RepID=A0AAW1SDJ6_9CHLO